MDPVKTRHVHFPSPLCSSRRFSTPLSTPSTPLLLSPSLESPTFRPLHVRYETAKRSLSLDSFLVLTAIQPPRFCTKPSPIAKSNPRGFASRILQAVLPAFAITNPLTHSRSYQDGMREKEEQQRAAPGTRGMPGSVSCYSSSQSGIHLAFASSSSKAEKIDHCLTGGGGAAPSVLLSQKNRGKSGVDFPLLLLNGGWKRSLKSKLKSRPYSKSFKSLVGTEVFAPNKISTSSTFPMTAASGNGGGMEEFNEDFVPYSYVEKGSTSNSSPTDESVQIRRMSLKEFSGLDQPEFSTSSVNGSKNDLTAANINPNVGSPLLARLHTASLSTNVGNLLDKFSNRRRSSAGLTKLSTWNSFAASGAADPVARSDTLSGENLYDSFDMAIEGINMAINEASTKCANGSTSNSASNTSPTEQKPQLMGNKMFEQVYQKLETVKERLTTTMKNVPNESPKKVEKGSQNEKLEVLNETRCKSMVRSTSQSINDKEFFPLIQTAVHSADKVTQAVEAALRKKTSLFQAQLLTAKTEQMLKALTETVRDLEKAYGTPKHGQEAKQLVRSSTTLAASLTQLIQAVQHI